MLRIRLQRFGKKKQPHFRVVVVDKRRGPKSGNYHEAVGWRNPREHTHVLNKERISYWISKGAQPSDTVHNLLVREGIIKGKKIDVASKKNVSKKSKEKENKFTTQIPVEENNKQEKESVDK